MEPYWPWLPNKEMWIYSCIMSKNLKGLTEIGFYTAWDFVWLEKHGQRTNKVILTMKTSDPRKERKRLLLQREKCHERLSRPLENHHDSPKGKQSLTWLRRRTLPHLRSLLKKWTLKTVLKCPKKLGESNMVLWADTKRGLIRIFSGHGVAWLPSGPYSSSEPYSRRSGTSKSSYWNRVHASPSCFLSWR